MFTEVAIFLIAIDTCLCTWNYDEQDLWPIKYCQGSISQSPINIETKKLYPIMIPHGLELVGWDKNVEATTVNTGHKISLTMPPGLTVSGATLPGTYNVAEFHFHWAAEHTIDGHRHDFETHIVSFNEKYESESDAKRYVYGIVIISILSQTNNVTNPAYTPIISRMDTLKKPGNSVSISVKLSDFLPSVKFPIYRYMGSYSTPNCQDGAIWLVMEHLSTITKEQIEALSSIEDVNGRRLVRTFRDERDVDGRTLFKLNYYG